LGKPTVLHALTAFLASNFYAGQHPKPLHSINVDVTLVPSLKTLYQYLTRLSWHHVAIIGNLQHEKEIIAKTPGHPKHW